MAASVNYANEGLKLNSGNELLVTIDIISENAIIVTGFVGSRKYKGALLGYQCDNAKPFVQENMFNWDYSMKDNFSYPNLLYKSPHISDTSITPSRLLAGSNYICANCKMKMYNSNTQMDSKTQNTDVKDNIIYKSDIILLKQTLSYPDLSLDSVLNAVPFDEIHSTESWSPAVIRKKLKRRKPSPSNDCSDSKRKRLVSFKEEIVVPKPCKIEKIEEKQPMKESRYPRNCKQNNDNKMKPIVSKEYDKSNDHENYRVMPQTLSRLNNISSQESYQEMEEFINRECPKPKKIWMQMIECEDNQCTEESLATCSSTEAVNADGYDKSFTDSPIKECDILDSLVETNVEVPPIDLLKEPQIVEILEKECSSTTEGPSIEVTKLESITDCVVVESTSKESPSDTVNENVPPELINGEQSSESTCEDVDPEQTVKESDVEPISKDSLSESGSDILPISKQGHQSKFSYFNRSYKIKQTLHDKVILTVERESSGSLTQNVPLINDIYSFTDDDDAPTGNNPNVNSCLGDPGPVPSSLSDMDGIPINGAKENYRAGPIKSLRSNSSNRSKTRKKLPSNKIDKTVFEETRNLENKVDDVSLVPVLCSCENSSGTLFKLDDVVWAKITGYPYWPARIMSFSVEEDMFVSCLEWYAWKEVSFIKVNSLFHFKECYQSKYQRKKRNGKYQEAVKLARICCGMLDGVDSAHSDDLGTLCSTKGSDSESESSEGSGTSAS